MNNHLENPNKLPSGKNNKRKSKNNKLRLPKNIQNDMRNRRSLKKEVNKSHDQTGIQKHEKYARKLIQKSKNKKRVEKKVEKQHRRNEQIEKYRFG